MKILIVSALLALNVISAAPQNQDNLSQGQNPSSESDHKGLQDRIQATPFHLSPGMTEFAYKLYDEYVKDEDGNVVFSPFSLHMALSMPYFGSPLGSETNSELERLLGLSQAYQQIYPMNYLQLINRYEDLTKRLVTRIQTASKIYTDKSFTPKQDFVSLLKLAFKTSQEQLNFADNRQSAEAINSFVSNKTGGLISELLSPDDIDGLTKMILVNAIYFKADWQTKFDPLKTAPGTFSTSGENFTHKAMMNVEGDFGIAEFPNFKVLELPYKSDGEEKDSNKYIRMLIVLPNEGVDIQRVDSAVKMLNWTSIDQRMNFGHTAVRLPKFKIGSKSELVPKFQRLGVTTLFNPEQADLSDITDVEKISVKHVVHQAELEVTEEGSEAAAATSVSIGTRTVGTGKRSFLVDRPFTFVIHDKAFDVPLFMGRVVDPTGVRRLKQEQQQQQSGQGSPVQRASAVGPAPPASPTSLVETAEKPCPDPSALGPADNQQISFPCKGQDTAVVRENEERQREALKARTDKFLENH